MNMAYMARPGIPNSGRAGALGRALRGPQVPPGGPNSLRAPALARALQPPGWGSQGAQVPDQHLPPKPPTAPTAAQTAPTNSGTTQTGASPLDSTYFANVAARQAQVNNQVSGLNQQGGYALTDLQNALANLAYQEPRDQLKAEQAANSRGALYSTVYNQNLGDLTRSYGLKQSGAQDTYQRGQAARQSQIAALQAGLPIYEAQQAASAAERASANAASNPNLTAPAPAASPATSPTGALADALASKPKGNPITANNLSREKAMAQALAAQRYAKAVKSQPPRNTINRRFL